MNRRGEVVRGTNENIAAELSIEITVTEESEIEGIEDPGRAHTPWRKEIGRGSIIGRITEGMIIELKKW